MSSTATLLLALLSLVAWVTLAFVVRLEVGAVHLLLAAGVALAIRWWALRPEPS